MRRSAFVALTATAAAVLAWHLVVVWLRVPHWVMPSPGATAAALWRERGPIAVHLGYTLTGALLGLVLSAVLALVLAAGFAMSRRAAQATMPFLVVLRTVPVVAVAPLLVMAVGRTLWTSLAVAVIVSFFPILVNGLRGFLSTPAPAIELMHVAGARWWHELLKVRLPYALPHIFTGLRIAAGSALLGAMLAEWLSGTPGLGFLILDSAAMQDTARLWAVALVGMATGLALYGVTRAVERRVAEG